MVESSLLFEEAPYLKLTVTGRKTGLKRTVQLWFAYEDGKIFFLAHKGSQWWKNLSRNPKAEIEVLEVAFQGLGRLVPDKLSKIYNLFSAKYGIDQMERWYEGRKRSQRQAIEVEVGRVIGKRPETSRRLESIINIA